MTPTSRPDWPALYTAHHLALTPNEIDAFLARGRSFNLAPVLASGGAIVFPHAAVMDCGAQVSAAVEAVLEAQADRVLVLGVLHAWTPAMTEARARVAAGEDLTDHPLRGIHGPDWASPLLEWQLDHSLISWRFFLEAACRARGRRPPTVREAYPFLAGASPHTLPGYEEVAAWAEDAVVVATADMVHHGVGYGDSPATALAPDQGGLDYARQAIEENMRLLASGDLAAYLRHCVATRNDARDNGPLLQALTGPLHGELIDLATSDMSAIYDAPPPTWVAAALTAWHRS